MENETTDVADAVIEVKELREELDALTASRDTLKAAIEQYLEWGEMTGSDRDLFERKFRAALAVCVPPQEK